VNLAEYRSILWVTNREIDAVIWQELEERLVVYRPPLAS
jgi:cobalt-precorrin 5A hydrolase